MKVILFSLEILFFEFSQSSEGSIKKYINGLINVCLKPFFETIFFVHVRRYIIGEKQ